MDLLARLNELELKKAQKQMILDAVRAGSVPGVRPAGEHFARRADEAPFSAKLLEELPNGRIEEDGAGRVFVFESRVDLNGNGDDGQLYRLPMSSSIRSHMAARLYPDAVDGEGFDCSRVAFIDTETTGLVGGTGTVPFLIGVGWFDCNEAGEFERFVVEQYLIDDYCHEPAQLRRLEERLSRFEYLCTYNGKCFDVPLLRTRFVLNRMKHAPLQRPHIDLLHFSRRLWRGAFPDVSLSSVEQYVMGIAREQDVEGALIPQIWANFARTGHCGRLPLVIHHNAQDIVSLAALLSLHLDRLHQAEEEPKSLSLASECVGLGRWFEQHKDFERACALYERGLELIDEAEEELALQFRLAALYRRRNLWPEAVEVWQQIQKRPLGMAMPAFIELAKYLEHRERDLEAARGVIDDCLRRVELEEELRMTIGRPLRGLMESTHVDDLRKRLERVECKIRRRQLRPSRRNSN